MAEMIDWVKSSPAKTKITQPMWLHIHKAFNQTSGVRASDNEPWRKQNCLVSDPGDPESEGIFCSFWNTDCLKPDIGKTLKITPGPKGGGIEIEDDYKDASKRTLKVSESANVTVDGAQVASSAATPTQPATPPPPPTGPPPFNPGPPAGGQASAPPASTAGTQGNLLPPPPSQQPPAQQTPADQGAAAVGRDANLKTLRDMLYGSAQAFELSMDASVMIWDRLNQRHGLAPSIEDIRATAVTLLINAKDAMTSGSYGSGSLNACSIPHTIEREAPKMPGQQLVAERAKVELMLEGYAENALANAG